MGENGYRNGINQYLHYSLFILNYPTPLRSKLKTTNR
jgi:hypothetical protein